MILHRKSSISLWDFFDFCLFRPFAATLPPICHTRFSPYTGTLRGVCGSVADGFVKLFFYALIAIGWTIVWE
jgi:hypothetical protein